ncbi:aminoglycoside phosphotransferase [Geothrix limicola]|uniref:Aminoglycoside phosphotransferase n=1 Tax=Geothrix limicola TaxID=2927978 RepID=A0ABQ5QF80_9BACT|nr:phosphotransferase [Geothrix limicola]GLH73171.1 aminoglycoside phosphotransferase [Geothrix limicola]
MSSPALSLGAAARLAGSPVRALKPLGGGRNSQVYRLETEEDRVFALKAYFRHAGDPRDRLGTEFSALRFLWERGLRCVPQPLAMDAEAGLGLYEFIEGRPQPQPAEADLDAAWGFLVGLRDLASDPAARSLPEASEACFSLRDVAQNIQSRLDRLGAVDSRLAQESGLAAFLNRDLGPAWLELLDDCQGVCLRSGLAFDAPLPQAQRTLSPSDFGFHNALKRAEGMVFLDFEYFGWDDPAKMLADFLLHPGMELTLRQRQRFAAGLIDHLDLDTLPLRTRLSFPLFGIKWCLILLNEFLKGSLDRRAFADFEARGAEERQAQQLEKARLKLRHLLDDHAHFPYFPL